MKVTLANFNAPIGERMSENKTNFIMAVRGYKSIKKEKNSNFTDITAIDNSNNKVLLRIIEPFNNAYIDINDIINLKEAIDSSSYASAIVISKKFTDNALAELDKQKIQHVSDDYMLPFEIHELYLAIINCVNVQCQKKCGKVVSTIPECPGKINDFCKTRTLAEAAKRHFEEGNVGLMKNDLKVALALTR